MEGDSRPNSHRRDAISAALRRNDEDSCIIMGILNITPDSFHAASRQTSLESAIENGLRMWRQGATWVDVGGESTRPNADFVSQQEELDRVIPVIIGLRQANTDGLLSIDTRRPEVARRSMMYQGCAILRWSRLFLTVVVLYVLCICRESQTICNQTLLTRIVAKKFQKI